MVGGVSFYPKTFFQKGHTLSEITLKTMLKLDRAEIWQKGAILLAIF